MNNKIKTTSHILYRFFQMLCWAIPLTITYFTFFNLESMYGWGMWGNLISYGEIKNISNFGWMHKGVLLVIQAMPLSITVIIFHKLAKLFHLFEQGFLFEYDNIKLIKHIGVYLFCGELVQLIYQPLLTAALTFYNPHGEHFARITLGTANASTLITACVIFVASWIIQEAHRLKSDAQLTI